MTKIITYLVQGILVFLSGLSLYGQQEPNYTQYMYNTMTVNPAYVGSTDNFNITADSADDLMVTVNGVGYTEGDGNLTDNGDNTWTLTIPEGNALPDGTYDVIATATDAAGNSSTDATTDELIIDTMVPTVPSVDFLTTNDNTPTITGTADSADDLTVVVNGVLSFVTKASTVGTGGAIVSMVSSSVVASVDVLPAASVEVAITSYVPSGSAFASGIVKVQVLSPLSTKFPSPSV